jgi:hypothetical protein
MAVCVASDGEIGILRGYEAGTFWDWRALAGTRDAARHSLSVLETFDPDQSPDKAPANGRLGLPALARR